MADIQIGDRSYAARIEDGLGEKYHTALVLIHGSGTDSRTYALASYGGWLSGPLKPGLEATVPRNPALVAADALHILRDKEFRRGEYGPFLDAMASKIERAHGRPSPALP